MSARQAALPQAGGQPIRADTAEAAAEWLTLFMSGEADAAQQHAWQQWRAADPEHERAWLHIEAVAARLHGLHGGAASRSLAVAAATSPAGRRATVKALLALAVTAGGTVLVAQTPAWQRWRADYASATGARREVVLADGSRITLNSGSAIDVDFNGERRLVRLLQGEVLVVAAHAGMAPGSAGATDTAAARPAHVGWPLPPLVVQTLEGSIRAVGVHLGMAAGPRFTVRQFDGRSRVAVLGSAVQLQPRDASAATLLAAGRSAEFTDAAVGALSALDPASHAWLRGQMIADDMRLDDFLAELGRYRPGLLRCTAEVAAMRVSGTFPLDNTERILDMLPNVLPVQVRERTRYWVTVEARA